MYFRQILCFDYFFRLKLTSGVWFLFHKLRYAKDKVRIHKYYVYTALIQHDDKFCVCQIDHFSLVYGTKKCEVLSEGNVIWRNFEGVITKKTTKQIL